MKLLSDQPPGIYVCWVTLASTGFFINEVVSPTLIRCIYDGYAKEPKQYAFFSEADLKYALYERIIHIPDIDIDTFDVSNYPEWFI